MLDRLEALAREAQKWSDTIGKQAWYSSDELVEAGKMDFGEYTDVEAIDAADANHMAALDPQTVLKIIAALKAAQRQVQAYDTLANKPVGEFSGNEVVACDEADDALRLALAELER
jgi:hypothetical protein